MRKAIVIFLLALLPFQFVWGAAAGYCQHEQGSEAAHFGHHFHKHQGKAAKSPGGSERSSTQPVAEDADCIACHMNCAAVISSALLSPPFESVMHVAPTVGPSYSRLPIPSIDRPKWVVSS